MSYEFKSDFARHYIAIGMARGWPRAVLLVLEGRGVGVPDGVREQIADCTDLDQLDAWLRRAVTATTAEEVVAVEV